MATKAGSYNARSMQMSSYEVDACNNERAVAGLQRTDTAFGGASVSGLLT